jgi:hypothetical protein
MKKICLLVLALITIASGLSAQHCPFDGSAIVVIKLTDAAGKPVTDLSSRPCLIETDNPFADSCKYAKGLLSLPFDSPQKNLVEKYEGSWKYRAGLYLKNCVFNQPGFYVVVLNQAQKQCMLERGNDYKNGRRSFEIRLNSEKGNMPALQVPEESIYSLCTGSGSWTRIEPIEIILKN